MRSSVSGACPYSYCCTSLFAVFLCCPRQLFLVLRLLLCLLSPPVGTCTVWSGAGCCTCQAVRVHWWMPLSMPAVRFGSVCSSTVRAVRGSHASRGSQETTFLAIRGSPGSHEHTALAVRDSCDSHKHTVLAVRGSAGSHEHTVLAVRSLSPPCPLSVPSLSVLCPFSVPSLSPVCPLLALPLSSLCPLSVPPCPLLYPPVPSCPLSAPSPSFII